MRCHCGYEAPSIEPAQSALWKRHTQSEHSAFVWGASHKLLEILSKYDVTPKPATNTTDTTDRND